jgi:hypothetical protein
MGATVKMRTLACAWDARARVGRLEESRDGTAIASAPATALGHVALCCKACAAKPRQAAQVIASSVVDRTSRHSTPPGVCQAILASSVADQSVQNHLAQVDLASLRNECHK